MMVMSSTIFVWWGISSLIQLPDLPYWLNLKMDGATGNDDCPEVMPVMRCPCRTESGNSVPCNLRSEERRVGKERRSRWSRYHDKKNNTGAVLIWCDELNAPVIAAM